MSEQVTEPAREPERIELTHATVVAAVCPPGRKDRLVFDCKLKGFGLRVTAAGSKTFLVQYSTATGKRRMSLGEFGPKMTVDQARRRALAELGEVVGGGDPYAEKRKRAAEERAAAAAAAALAAEEDYTVAKLIEEWEKARAEKGRRPSYLRIATGSLRRHFAKWLDRPASSVTPQEAMRRLDDIRDTIGTTAANRALAYARAAFGWAAQRQTIASNPLEKLEAPGHEKARERVLSKAETGLVWRGSAKLGTPYDAFVRVLLLTLQRRDEIAGMRWSEIAPDLSVWTLPSDRSKNHKAHIVHLAEPVRAILAAVPRVNDCPFVFPGERGKPVCAFSYAKRNLDAAIADLAPSAPVKSWTLHDFRRSGVTALADMGFAPHVCDRLLNHISGTIRAIAAVYQRAEFLGERKAALDAWAQFVLAAAEEREAPANVVRLRA